MLYCHPPCWDSPAQTHMQVNTIVMGVGVLGCWITTPPSGLPCTNTSAGQHHHNGGGRDGVLHHPHPCWGSPAQTLMQVNTTIMGLRVLGGWGWGGGLPLPLSGLPCTNTSAGQHHRNWGESNRVLDRPHPCRGSSAQTHLQVNITIKGLRALGCCITTLLSPLLGLPCTNTSAGQHH